ncbi:fam-c protein [Plasmodium vinckei petteri]|uniref:Fam-c protein n=1 Tax=Plasmodium vinckei petteri TaxID=138298 RepID=A0A6V7SWA0_PLAVN|nr:fam-c protein [Plasmodium vinckei petteri]
MNKKIFSLVCILFYILMAVSIYCSEQKESGLRSRIIRAFKKTNRSNKKNDIESQREIQLNNNNNVNDAYKKRLEVEESCCYCCCACLYDDDDFYK